MPQYDPAVIAKYRALLKKDPTSQVFAPLADAYREAGQIVLAEKIVREGIRRHPNFAGGLVVLGKILKDQKKTDEALSVVQKAAQIVPDNLLAHQLEGDLLLEMKNPQAALKAYKMVLFINPQSVKARKVVQKLESLTAADYDEDIFSMARLDQLDLQPSNNASRTMDTSLTKLKNISEAPVSNSTRSLQRALSLMDAFIVRNDLGKAQDILRQAREEYGDQMELDQRERVLRSRTQTSLLVPQSSNDEATPVRPLASREQETVQNKLEKLQMLLRRIEEFKAPI